MEDSGGDELFQAVLRQGGQQGAKWLWGALGGAGLLVVGLILLFMAVTMALFGWLYGSPHPPPIPPDGTAPTRPAEWLDALPVRDSALPNAVILAVMAHESGGRVAARNYNCQDGQASAGMRCSRRYHVGALGVGQILHTVSEDAGLMQVNSGGWPAPRNAAKWRALHMASNPFDPGKNLAAGVNQLQGDLARWQGRLKWALEAYNSGSGGPGSADAGYARAVRSGIAAAQAAPTVSVWSTASWDGSRWTWQPGAWLLAAAAGPFGTPFAVPWKPPHRVCVPVTRPHGGQTTVCRMSPTPMVAGRDLELPVAVTAGGTPMALSPKGAPIWPGAEVWALPVSHPGTFRVVARWPGGQTASGTITLRAARKAG